MEERLRCLPGCRSFGGACSFRYALYATWTVHCQYASAPAHGATAGELQNCFKQAAVTESGTVHTRNHMQQLSHVTTVLATVTAWFLQALYLLASGECNCSFSCNCSCSCSFSCSCSCSCQQLVLTTTIRCLWYTCSQPGSTCPEAHMHRK